MAADEESAPLRLGSGLDALGTGRISVAPYLSASFFEKEKEIWQKTWVMAARESQFAKPGDYLTFDLKAVNKPLFIVLGQDGKLRAFYNVCQHRGGRLLGLDADRTRGNVKHISCRFHRWSYRLDGTLMGIPERQLFPALEPQRELALKPVHLDAWGGFVFVNLAESPAWTLAEYLAGVPAGLGRYCADPAWVWHTGFQTQLACNWKDALNIQHEGYHASALHEKTLGLRLKASMVPVTLFTDSPGMTSLSTSLLPPEAFARTPPAIAQLARRCLGIDGGKLMEEFPGAMNHANDEHFSIDCLTFFPNFMIDSHLGYFMTMRVWPLAHDRAELEWDFFFRGAPRDFGELFSREQVVIATRDVLTEDWYVIEKASKSLGAGVLDGVHVGRDMEASVRALHEKLLHHLSLTEEDLRNDYA